MAGKFSAWLKIGDLTEAHPFALPLIYLLATLPIIIFLAYFRQPIGVADEWSHIARAAQLADGTVFTEVAEQGQEPQGSIDPQFHKMTQEIHARRHDPLAILMPDINAYHWTEERILKNYNSSVYIPVPYAISIAAIHYGQYFQYSIVKTLQILNLWNGIVCIVLVAVAMALCRRGRFIIFAIAALPMSLYLFASASPDGPLISSALLVFALMNRTIETGSLSGRSLIFATLFAALIAGTKLPYLPAMVAIIVGLWCFAREQRPAWPALLASLTVVVLVPLIWTSASNAGAVDASWSGRMIAPSEQIAFLLQTPLAIFHIAQATFETFGWRYPHEMVGYLGWLDAPISWNGAMLLLFLLVTVVLLDRPDRSVGRARWGIATGLLLSLGGIFLSLYIAFNPVGSLTGIAGVQGRYFLPLLAFFAFLFPSSALRPWKLRSAMLSVILLVLVSQVELIQTVINRYYL